jgi:CDP-diacylglycerol--glycerol-3-phosphate 3-phosphatidyltransferase
MSTIQKSETKNQPRDSFRILPKSLMILTLNVFDSVARLFVNLNISPNFLSVVGLLIGIGVGILFFFEQPFWAGILILICGIFDILDGKVAVKLNKKSLYGAIFDSTLDRYSEFFIYLGLAWHFRNSLALWVLFFTFLGSTMVSYTRARAEGLGIDCKVGVMQRAERIVLLSLAAIFGPPLRIFDPAMIVALALIALLSNITAIQRICFVKKIENLKKTEKEV